MKYEFRGAAGPWAVCTDAGADCYCQFPGDVAIRAAPEDEHGDGWFVAVAIGDVSSIPTNAHAALIAQSPALLSALIAIHHEYDQTYDGIANLPGDLATLISEAGHILKTLREAGAIS